MKLLRGDTVIFRAEIYKKLSLLFLVLIIFISPLLGFKSIDSGHRVYYPNDQPAGVVPPSVIIGKSKHYP